MRLKLCFFAFASFLICSCAADETIPAVTSVFYETYCPDSIKFINKQLYPTYLKLNGSYFLPRLLPFGRANFTTLPNGTQLYSCQHGEKECYGNKVHTCVLHMDTHPLNAKMQFINCTMARTDLANTNPLVYPIEECAAESQFNAQEIKNCVGNSTYMKNLLEAYSDETKKYAIPGFPFIMFDQNFDVAKSKESEQNLASVICKNYIPANDTKYDGVCKSQNNSATMLVFTAFPVIVLTFVFSKLY